MTPVTASDSLASSRSRGRGRGRGLDRVVDENNSRVVQDTGAVPEQVSASSAGVITSTQRFTQGQAVVVNETTRLHADLLEAFFCYFESTWMEGSFPSSYWVLKDLDSPVTNNHVEGWHNKLNKVFLNSIVSHIIISPFTFHL